MRKIEDELIRATGFKAKGRIGEVRIKALINAVHKLDDDDWDRLSSPAQTWVNKADAAIKAGRKIKPFPADDPPTKKVKTKKGKLTAQTLVMRAVLANPDVTNDEIIEKLESHGFNATRFLVATAKSNFKRAFREIKAAIINDGLDVRKLNV